MVCKFLYEVNRKKARATHGLSRNVDIYYNNTENPSRVLWSAIIKEIYLDPLVKTSEKYLYGMLLFGEAKGWLF